MIRKIIFITIGLFVSSWAHAFSSFEVSDIRLEGLQRISIGTVFNYLPVRIGDVMDEERSVVSIQDLFKTGFFEDVHLARDENVLVVTVVERPAISEINFSGNKDIDSDQLIEGLKQIGLSKGRTFDLSLLDKVEQELQRQYFARGKYGVKIDSKVVELERNRVDVEIEVSEGSVASIAKINIVGNSAFSNEVLLGRIQLGGPGALNPFSSRDQYSKQKLSADLETIKSYYLDRGYVNFNVESTQVTITPDRENVYITINVFEGDKFTIKETVLSGDLVVAETELLDLLLISAGDEFSRSKIARSSDRISERLGLEGYAFSNINPIPDINNETKEVSMTFFIDPGKRIYVRRVNIDGNTQTKDEVIRREFRQFEGGWIGTDKISRTRDRLMRLGYFENVNIETPLVPGVDDQVDVNVSVTERSSGSLQAGMGYSETQGVMFTASISHDNFFGSGKRVSAEINTSQTNTIYSFSHTNPYFTRDGISRTFSGFYRKTDTGARNTADYNADTYGAGMNFGFPLSELYRFRAGLNLEHTEIHSTDSTPQPYLDFLADNTNKFELYKLSIGWTYDSRDRAIFPKRGLLNTIDYEVTYPDSGLNYYKVTTRLHSYIPISSSWTLFLGGQVGYGDAYKDTTALPFFENYYAGGVRTVRGYDSNTLGPKEGTDPLGGTFKVVTNAELYFPVPFNPEATTFRLGLFYDLGYVYGDVKDFDASELRAATGLSATWLSPIGPMVFSWAKALRTQEEDRTKTFQFSLGGSF